MHIHACWIRSNWAVYNTQVSRSAPDAFMISGLFPLGVCRVPPDAWTQTLPLGWVKGSPRILSHYPRTIMNARYFMLMQTHIYTDFFLWLNCAKRTILHVHENSRFLKYNATFVLITNHLKWNITFSNHNTLNMWHNNTCLI